jgi:hypothetical protein
MHICIGLFAVVTAVLAGATLGRVFGWSSGDGTYLTMLVLAVVGWWMGRRAGRQEERR